MMQTTLYVIRCYKLYCRRNCGYDTIAWLVNDNPVGVATQVWSPPAGTINDGDSVR
ncbi:MAG: hypothetical protein CM15mP122_5310 [Bacteroidota bacterium]|nr:MAG: hypothetical protein CM15mP122_5310 [Bacteroidota bacterium]